ncbi:MAG: response regulator transcription factor [Crocinitomicaceae bacterium]|nr:response regulator transcription factor [Flavobacteriales bacterium]NQZ36914.1 response regulator transcription factor [Crocinitomicaceae bacterium]
MIKIITADDHQIVLDGLKALLEDQSEFQVIGEAKNGKELIEACNKLNPDLILTDIGMPVMDGIEALRSIKKTHPELKTLVLTTYTDRRNIREMLKIDVDGYLLKDSGKAVFIEAINAIMTGEKYYDKRVTEIMMNSFSKSKKKPQSNTPLTKREKDIVRLISEGLDSQEISGILFISLLTVETHRKNIYTKLGINKIASLVRYALEEGLIE